MPLRVLLTVPPTQGGRPIRDILVRQSDVEIIDAAPCRGVELLLLLRKVEPEVLVIESEATQNPGLCDFVFGEYPHLTVLAVSPDAQDVTLHWLRAESLMLSASALENLADEIRAVAHL